MKTEMTAYQLLLSIIVQRARDNGFKFEEDATNITSENVEDLYCELEDAGEHWDYKSELRGGEVETQIPCDWSSHYESQSVAAKAPNGQWVGWTYWYGGGKHGEPEAIDWMEDAYFLDCKEEEKMVVVRTFSKVDEEAA